MSHFANIVIFTILLLVLNSNSFAHEPREGVSDTYTIIVGNRFEPPYAGQMNRFDMFVRDLEGNPITIDDLDLEVKVLYLKKEDFDAKVLARAILKGDLKEDRDTQGRLNIDYLPTRAGTYGFIISGTINGVYIEEKYVCGNGSQHPDGRAFSCVNRLQKFPRGRHYYW